MDEIGKKYTISENEYRELLISKYMLMALDQGGVDNWSYYSDSLNNFINRYIKENDISTDDEDCWWWFSNMVDDILSKL